MDEQGRAHEVRVAEDTRWKTDIQAQLASLKTDVASLHTSFRELQTDFADLKVQVLRGIRDNARVGWEALDGTSG